MKMTQSVMNVPLLDVLENVNATNTARNRCAVSGLAGAILAALYPLSPALAQEADEPGAGELETITVTATKRSENLQDVPQSITAFTTADIEKNAFKNMADYVRALPSVQLINLRPGRNELSFRGISTGTGEYRLDSQVAVYLDEQPITTISQQVSPYMVDIERVESLPGPQGTLFGSSSQTGTLRIITNKPDTEAFSGQVFGEARFVHGGDPGYEVNGVLNIPMADNTMALRLVAYATRDGGWVDNVYSESLANGQYAGPDYAGPFNNAAFVENNFNDSDLYGGRATLKLDLSDKLEVLASFITEDGSTRGSWDVDPHLGKTKTNKFLDESSSDKWWQGALTITADVGFASLVSNTAYFSRDIAYEWDNMTYGQWKDSYWGYYNGLDLYNTQYTPNYLFNDQKQTRFSQEIRLSSNNDSRFQWMAGFFYEDVQDAWLYGADNPDLMSTIAWQAANYYAHYDKYVLGYDVDYPLAPTTYGYTNHMKRTIKQTAFFGEMSYKLTDQWSATVGARWFQYDRNQYDQYQFPQGLPPSGGGDTLGAYSSQGKQSDTIFKFSTQYNFTDTNMVYALFSQGFRLGGFNSPRAANTGLIPYKYKPDTMDNYEVGMKSEWLDNRLLFNIDFFLMKWNDIQVTSGSVDNVWWLNGTYNGKTAEQKGVELNTTWWITESFQFLGSMTLTNPEFTDTFTEINGDVVPKGTTMPISPERVFWGAVEYNFDQWHPFGGDLWVRYDQNYTGAKWNSLSSAIDENPNGRMPSFSIANFQVGLDLPTQWNLTFFIRNVWNEYGMSWLSSSDYQAEWFGNPAFQHYRTYLPPRTIGFNFRKSF